MGRKLGEVEKCEEWKRQGKQRIKKEVAREINFSGSEIKANRWK